MQLPKRTLSLRLNHWLTYSAALIIALIPFHAFLTVWVASAVGHYTALRLWKEFLLIILVAKCMYMARGRLHEIRGNRLALAMTLFIGLQIIAGVIAYATRLVSLKALGYGWISDLRFLLFFGVVWWLASQSDWLKRHYKALVLVPAAIVAVFAILQYSVLPPGFLKHFGYGPATISVSETIDHKQQYTRVAATTRGANPLGAYLLVIISMAAVLIMKGKDKRYQYGLLLAAALVALVFTFSRGAWLGLVFSLAALVWLSIKSRRARRLGLIAAASIVIIAAGLTLGLRHNDGFQNAFFHTDEHSTSGASSNAGHIAALKDGLHDFLHEPFGRGPGTAGPASTYNNGYRPRIAENYFLQVGQETGWLGLVLFGFIMVELLRLLYVRRQDPLALSLFISLIGLIVVNLLSHAWADDTLSYLWWGLAGMALASTPVVAKKQVRHGK
jgi:hypothetical protein